MSKILAFMGKLFNLCYSILRLFIGKGPKLFLWFWVRYFAETVEVFFHIVAFESEYVRGFQIIEVKRRSGEHGEKISNDF